VIFLETVKALMPVTIRSFTNTAGNNPFYFFDPASPNFPGRFYRAKLP
jgi:hypothetical protein